MIKLYILLAVVIYIAQQYNIEDSLYSGKVQLDLNTAKQVFKLYKNENEYEQLLPIFYPNLQRIVRHNLDKQQTWKMGVNQFAFITEEEFKNNYLGASSQNCSATAVETLKNRVQLRKLEGQDIPQFINWTAQNKVAPVKDQRKCGSCWAFSTVAAIESHWAIKYDTYPTYLSEQQLVDCAQDFDNHGCSGGLPSHAFEYIKYNGGINFENVYPYFAVDGNGCDYSSEQKGAYVKGGSFNITFEDEEQLKEKVGTVGPVSVAYQVYGDFKFYKSGIYSDPNCSSKSDDVNHAVLVAGYGEEKGEKYWYIKNSWSSLWGDNGYFKMLRGQNMCGVADCASYPLIE